MACVSLLNPHFMKSILSLIADFLELVSNQYLGFKKNNKSLKY